MTKRSSTARSYPVRIPRVPVGPLAPTLLGECSRWLAAKGYSSGSAAGAMNVAQRLSMWMEAVGAGVDGIDEELLGRLGLPLVWLTLGVDGFQAASAAV